MSTDPLGRLLSGDLSPGVYRWDDDRPRGEVHHLVMECGADFAHVDTSAADSRGAVLAVLGNALDFPETYGRNLDALAVHLAAVEQVVVLWDGCAPVAADQPRSFAAVLEVLRERARRDPPFSVLVRGVSDHLDLPLLG